MYSGEWRWRLRFGVGQASSLSASSQAGSLCHMMPKSTGSALIGERVRPTGTLPVCWAIRYAPPDPFHLSPRFLP